MNQANLRIGFEKSWSTSGSRGYSRNWKGSI